MDIDQAIRLARESIRAGNLSEDWREVRGGLDHAIAIDMVCAELEKVCMPTVVQDSAGILHLEQHIVDYTKVEDKYIFVCTCKATWSVGRAGATEEKLQESVKSHHISVGIKPSEVL